MTISRRFFLIGSASAALVASLPMASEAVEVTHIPADASITSRELFEVFASTDLVGPPSSVITIGRDAKMPIFTFPLGRGSVMQWCAVPGAEVFFLPDSPLPHIDWKNCPPNGNVAFGYRENYDDGGYQVFFRRFTFTDGQMVSEKVQQAYTQTRYPGDDYAEGEDPAPEDDDYYDGFSDE